ncbi:TauD/TfdA family dioxygenase [Actinophytocola gossypii]|uniref:TauD/TfdA family dioxygenase n=1 Tax=Actinophytocola gossypii TaxID=2812003 RepID=A0ABT2JJX0_9PSEU|nr:TauD/TfdA family dioxygenase [Actinophytocola gossypii]MCT2587680.1 TauD/TfdA family dioxygenase [Actinophytocola gossypii]
MTPTSWTKYRANWNEGSDAAAELVPALAEHGIVLLDGLHGPHDLLQLARAVAEIVPHRDSDAAGITTIADMGGHVRSGFAGFTARALQPHTDRSGVADPPALLMMSCGQPAASGGECVVIDGKLVYDDLAEFDTEALTALCTARSVLFGGAAGHLGSVFTRIGDHIAVRLRLDELAQFSPEVARRLPTLRAALDRHATTFRLDAGHGYILDNYRWIHGRRAFTGERVMFRIAGNPLPNLGLTAGFRPHHTNKREQEGQIA